MPDFSAMPEVFVSDARLAAAVSREVKRGTLRKLASRVYTRNLKDPPDRIVGRNLWPLVAAYLPGALIADRTALENRPAADGSIFLVANHKRAITLPGAILRPRRGHPPLESDRPFIGGLRLASPARAFLENMRPSRARQGVARTLPKREVEDRLEEMLRHGGEAALQRLRDDARKTARQLRMRGEFQRLDALIGTLLGSRRAQLQSPTAAARSAGLPYDPRRLDLFQRLHTELSGATPMVRLERSTDGPALPFFEAYFSNFIEGTQFAVDEAADIVFKGRIPRARPADAHDVLGTWKVVSDKREMSRLPRNIEELIAILTSRHARIMEGRPEQGPGQFKTEANRAGSTFFVAPELAPGTLAKGFEIYRGLAAPLHRAIFMMFLVSEVHPFAGGNGRVARVMMNAELVAAGENRVVVPTVCRNNYLMALKALSQNGITGAVVRMLDFAQRYTAAVDFADLKRARRILERTHAFDDPNEADARGISLILPAPDIVADMARF
jgi:hypothetical protein